MSTTSFEKRQKLSAKILQTYTDRLPIIVEPATNRAPALSKSKFLAPTDMTAGAFLAEIKKHRVSGDGSSNSNSAQAQQETLFLFVNNSTLVNSSAMISQIYDKHKNADGFLYLKYATENSFGGSRCE